MGIKNLKEVIKIQDAIHNIDQSRGSMAEIGMEKELLKLFESQAMRYRNSLIVGSHDQNQDDLMRM